MKIEKTMMYKNWTLSTIYGNADTGRTLSVVNFIPESIQTWLSSVLNVYWKSCIYHFIMVFEALATPEALDFTFDNVIWSC